MLHAIGGFGGDMLVLDPDGETKVTDGIYTLIEGGAFMNRKDFPVAA